MIIFGKSLAARLAFAIDEVYRDDLFLQPARLVSRVGGLLRAQRVLIHVLARNALLLGVEFGGVGHVEAAVGIEQRDHERIFQLAFA